MGRSIYYSKSNLVELAAMVYWLSTGISFDIACETLKQLKEQESCLFPVREAVYVVVITG
jgi:hypothetical protein